MPLRDPQTRIPLPSLARARPKRVRDEMTRGATKEGEGERTLVYRNNNEVARRGSHRWRSYCNRSN